MPVCESSSLSVHVLAYPSLKDSMQRHKSDMRADERDDTMIPVTDGNGALVITVLLWNASCRHYTCCIP